MSIEVSNIGAARRIQQWIPILHEALGTRTARVMADATIAKMEGIDMGALQRASDLRDRTVKITEHGIRYEVDFSTGHKTGFFCDQRENRLKLTHFTEGRDVLDLCCYTGGFSLAAKMRGRACRVVGVDLDEKSIAQAKRNANLNEARIEFTHADAFVYARQMQRNDTHFGTVVLDPPKFVLGREEIEEGRKKYFDLNRLALFSCGAGRLFRDLFLFRPAQCGGFRNHRQCRRPQHPGPPADPRPDRRRTGSSRRLTPP
ncbi:MAG: class I SAM-dependent methyltransferase [Verrucomicrobiales bacterium]